MIAIQGAAKELAAETEKLTASDNLAAFRQFLDVPVPISYLKDYDLTISMLSDTETEELTLERATYLQLVMDEWDWKRMLTSINAKLSDSASRYL